MTDYRKLVEALRCCSKHERRCLECEFLHNGYCSLQLDAAAAIEALQAEIRESMQKCAECGDEQEQKVKELQADVQILKVSGREAYFEGLAADAEPKRGEWIEEDLDNFRKYKVTCPHCGAWYVGNYDAYVEPWDFNYCPHCENICNPTNIEYENELKEREKEARAKMEAQDESAGSL